MTIPTGFKPMLSGKAPEDLSKLKFPVLVSPKLDGIRCVVFDGVAYSRNLKPIPNKRVQAFAKAVPHGFDGELISGDPTAKDVWNRTQSCVMSADSVEPFCFHVFDCVTADGPFKSRRSSVVDWCGRNASAMLRYVPHRKAACAIELREIEDAFVLRGYEGAMIRSLDGAYKFGRSTLREGGLLKLKRWHDAEAAVVDMVERMHNDNEAKKDELGRTKRSTHKANKIPTGTLGALVCVPLLPKGGKAKIPRFEIGTGFTEEQRKDIWQKPLGGKIAYVKFKYQELTPDGIPRFPVFLGFRDERDIT